VDVSAKVVIYEAFIEGRREAPKRLARSVHDPYFEPKYEEFRPRTIWSCGALFRIGQVGYSAFSSTEKRQLLITETRQ
jgi:hypothetical protein